MEEKKTLWQRLIAYLLPALAFRAKPGCTACMTPVLDGSGKPVIDQHRDQPK